MGLKEKEMKLRMEFFNYVDVEVSADECMKGERNSKTSLIFQK